MMQLHYTEGVGAAERVSDLRGQTVGSRPEYSLKKRKSIIFTPWRHLNTGFDKLGIGNYDGIKVINAIDWLLES